MSDRIKDIIEYRTGLSEKYFDKDIDMLSAIQKEGMTLNSQELKNLSDKYKLHEMGNVEIDDFKKDYWRKIDKQRI